MKKLRSPLISVMKIELNLASYGSTQRHMDGKELMLCIFKPQRSLEEAFANIMKEAHPLNEFFVEGIPKERIVKGKINNHEIVKYEILNFISWL